MADRILIYISAAADLLAEREALGQLISQMPTSLGWRVEQTPLDDREPNLDAVATADIHLLLLGSDVRAPVGLEWRVARRAGRSPSLFLKQEGLRTQAGDAFARELARHSEWRRFKTLHELRRQVAEVLVSHMAGSAERYALLPEEIERLRAWRRAVAAAKVVAAESDSGGAGASGVILSAERFTPSQGRLIGS
ncbi:MAG: hypothetical protein RMN25_13065 [Anaerolineae bacterium]|nr:hypothetical protein [Thermoflexales bacterium]MDW8408703.1 hypothetical protein [Anaerolineae bacterium]